jgi:cupin 2 domain-containing protein
MTPDNLLAQLPARLADERFDVLLETAGFRLERIISTGHATPPEQWYDQAHDEWILLLTGSAVLRFEQPDEQLALQPGDSLLIPAHRRHRVEATDPQQPTVWLALHFNLPPPFPPKAALHPATWKESTGNRAN